MHRSFYETGIRFGSTGEELKDIEEMLSANQRRWDEKARANWSSRFYDLDGFLERKDSLLPVEIAEVGNVSGKDLLHLQCHFGMDSLSWAARGARVTGVDFSSQAIAQAEQLSAMTGIPANFVRSSIYEVDRSISDRYDIVFTSYGVLCWLPDLKEWGRQIAERLRLGGFFYMVEGHPTGNMMDENCLDRFQAGYSYFNGPPERFDDDHAVDQGHDFQNKERYEWTHPLSEVVDALLSQGLRLEFLHEFPFGFFPMHPRMEKHDDGYWYLPEEDFNVPMLFSLKATKM